MKFITLLRLYSIQVFAILAAINTFVASRADVPWWFVLAINVVGVLVGMVAREVPQPVVVAKLKSLQ